MSSPTYMIAGILLPPFGFILMGLIGFAVWRWRPRLGRILVFASFALMWIASTIAVYRPIGLALAWPAPVDLRAAGGVQAIVVLGGGLYRDAREYGGVDTVNSRTLDRVRYGAWLVRQTGLPVLVSGGRPRGAPVTEAEVMKAVLENEFLTPVRWAEMESTNTFENARESARILRAAGIGKVFLVTDSFHMRRAVQSFAPTGIEVIAAPVNLHHQNPLTFSSFLPSATGFRNTNYIAHELLGRAWYMLRERFE